MQNGITFERAQREGSGWNLVLSYGDLSVQTGYRTRVLGELQHLDGLSGLKPMLMVFDRQPASLKPPAGIGCVALKRSEPFRFYPEAARLRRHMPVRVVHAHNLYSAALALPARPVFGYKVVVDYHGRIPEEYVFLRKGGAASRRGLELLERWVLRRSDHIIAVSQALAGYITARYRIPEARLSVIPCCADSALFRYDPELRLRTRTELGLADRLVCMHLGSFLEWYESELLIKVFQSIRARCHQAHLLALTPAVEEAASYLAARLPASTFTVTRCPHDRVPAFLNASDIGFLLLRDAPNIRTSSPVKFAEYLNCGLPVVITPGVGDFSEFVRQERLGEVLQGETVSEMLIDCVIRHREETARRLARAGQLLSWDAFGDSGRRAFS